MRGKGKEGARRRKRRREKTNKDLRKYRGRFHGAHIPYHINKPRTELSKTMKMAAGNFGRLVFNSGVLLQQPSIKRPAISGKKILSPSALNLNLPPFHLNSAISISATGRGGSRLH